MVAGQMVVSDRRPFTTQVLPNAAVPDLTVVTGVYLFVQRASGATAKWVCALASQSAGQILATYAPVSGDNDTAGELLHLRPYLTVSSSPDVPCQGYEIQVVAQ
jgi:hypothetical protein